MTRHGACLPDRGAIDGQRSTPRNANEMMPKFRSDRPLNALCLANPNNWNGMHIFPSRYPRPCDAYLPITQQSLKACAPTAMQGRHGIGLSECWCGRRPLVAGGQRETKAGHRIEGNAGSSRYATSVARRRGSSKKQCHDRRITIWKMHPLRANALRDFPTPTAGEL